MSLGGFSVYSDEFFNYNNHTLKHDVDDKKNQHNDKATDYLVIIKNTNTMIKPQIT